LGVNSELILEVGKLKDRLITAIDLEKILLSNQKQIIGKATQN
jgi:hypothetical protein